MQRSFVVIRLCVSDSSSSLTAILLVSFSLRCMRENHSLSSSFNPMMLKEPQLEFVNDATFFALDPPGNH